jgi:hypothetical protein
MTTEEERKERIQHDRVEGSIKVWLEKKEREKKKKEQEESAEGEPESSPEK